VILRLSVVAFGCNLTADGLPEADPTARRRRGRKTPNSVTSPLCRAQLCISGRFLHPTSDE